MALDRSPLSAVPRPKLRCAVYMRKSSEEGLEQSFNSLHAQRDACEAFIASQVHEGWRLVPEAYDDGGLSGGSMERPALQRLLQDVRDGLVDIVVVYKVDRLTRSLADFAKLTELFDAHGASFVSVTQAFNTSTSMGRLTLNVLLSFAQFEREVAGERIRDKIALSKRRGMWMGGLPPLGYDGIQGKLIINCVEADTVRLIFRRYVEVGSIAQLKDSLDADGIVSKHRRLPDWQGNGRRQSEQRRALSNSAQSHVPRPDRAPRRNLSGRAPGDCSGTPLERGSKAPERPKPAASWIRLQSNIGTFGRDDLRRRRHPHDTHLLEKGRATLSLLHLCAPCSRQLRRQGYPPASTRLGATDQWEHCRAPQ